METWTVLAVPATTNGGADNTYVVRGVKAEDAVQAINLAAMPNATGIRRLIRDLGLDENRDYDRVRVAVSAALAAGLYGEFGD